MNVVAIDVGGTRIRAATVRNGVVGEMHERPTPAAAGADAVVAEILAVLDAAGLTDAVGIGVATAGVVEPGTGRIAAATDLIAGWAETPLGARIQAATGLPVRVVNDVHAHGLGEYRGGACAGSGSLLLLAAGTGLGGAYVADGRLLLGSHAVAGHVGHLPCAEAAGLRCSCGATGHLECVASGSGLVALYASGPGGEGKRPPILPASGAEVVLRADAGDNWAADCVTTSGLALGRAAGGLINLLDPDRVVITGGLARAGERWWDAVHAGAAENLLPLVRQTPIEAGRLTDEAALLGAAGLFETH